MYTQRPYQKEALDGIREKLSQSDSTLLVCATGLGKTIIFSEFANEMLPYGRVMVLAHRGELIHQAVHHLSQITGVQPDIEMADFHSITGRNKSPIVVGTIQTQIAGRNGDRMEKFPPEDFSLLIIDEAHHTAAKSYKKVINYYKQNPELKILGVTATPDRADEKALGAIFQTVAYEYGIREGIDDGWLVPIQQHAVMVDGLDYSGVRTTAGDLNGADLAAILEVEENLHRMATPTIELCEDKKSLVFTASVFQAERFAEILNRHKPQCAEWVCGTTPKDERRYMFERYARNEFQYLVNVGVATEGFDDPSIEVIILGRPTKSRSLYAQMIGRGTRTLPRTVDGLNSPEDRKAKIALSQKPTVSVLDFVGNSGRHRLISSADILGGNYSDEVVERAKKNIEKSGRGDIISELEQAEHEIAEEARRNASSEKRKSLLLRAKYSTAKVNPFDILSIDPCREKGWNIGRQASDKQVALLQKWGVDTSGLSFSHASQLIDRLIKRRQQNFCSFKQAKLLRRYGYEPDNMSFKSASEIIDNLARNNWKRV